MTKVGQYWACYGRIVPRLYVRCIGCLWFKLCLEIRALVRFGAVGSNHRIKVGLDQELWDQGLGFWSWSLGMRWFGTLRLQA